MAAHSTRSPFSTQTKSLLCRRSTWRRKRGHSALSGLALCRHRLLPTGHLSWFRLSNLPSTPPPSRRSERRLKQKMWGSLPLRRVFFASGFTCTLKHDKTTYNKWTLKNCQDQAVALAIQLCPSLSRKISHLFLLSQSSPGMVDNNTSSSYSASDDNLPKIDLFGGGNVDLRTVAPLYGVASEEEPDYLDYDIKGRGTVERMFLYSGSSYLTGILAGGILGGRRGWKTAPSPRFWLRLNSVMNGAGKLGSKWGNNAGVFALMYSLSESLLDHFETDKVLGGHQAVNPVLSGAISGLLYKSTAAPRTAALASVLGGFGAGMFYVIRGQLDRFFYR